MANGKGWLDCLDCSHCEWKADIRNRYCNFYNVLLPSSEELEHKHIVCSKFIAERSKDSILNGEVIKKDNGANYYVYRRISPHHKSKSPIFLENDVLYAFHYHEQVLEPYLKLINEKEI